MSSLYGASREVGEAHIMAVTWGPFWSVKGQQTSPVRYLSLALFFEASRLGIRPMRIAGEAVKPIGGRSDSRLFARPRNSMPVLINYFVEYRERVAKPKKRTHGFN
jgi:hypothetical protein